MNEEKFEQAQMNNFHQPHHLYVLITMHEYYENVYKMENKKKKKRGSLKNKDNRQSIMSRFIAQIAQHRVPVETYLQYKELISAEHLWQFDSIRN